MNRRRAGSTQSAGRRTVLPRTNKKKTKQKDVKGISFICIESFKRDSFSRVEWQRTSVDYIRGGRNGNWSYEPDRGKLVLRADDACSLSFLSVFLSRRRSRVSVSLGDFSGAFKNSISLVCITLE